MNREVIRLQPRGEFDRATILSRLEGVVSIFLAINAGELLCALPDCPTALANHKAALKLLSIIETELGLLCQELVSQVS